MKIATGSSLTTSNISSSGKSFGISANGKAFKILSSSLYNYKPLAVVREISCNARDAHALINQLDRPFVVHLPAVDEPHFVVRDFGPGLSDEDVLGLYTTYFQSTKTESEEAIGGFGLGSKSPLSYANSFQVSSFHGGMKRTYLAFTKDSGEPDIYCLTETPSDEPTGLEVRVPVTEADFRKFRRSAENVFRFFAVKPIVHIGKALISDEDFYSFTLEDTQEQVVEYDANKCARFYKDKPLSEISNDHVWAKMGDVIYPISVSHVFEDQRQDERFISEFFKSTRYGKVVVDFVIGELDLNAGREGLSYDKATIARLKTVLSIVYARLVRVVNEKVAQCKTMQEAISLCGDQDKFFGSSCVNGMFTWKGTPVTESNYTIVDKIGPHNQSWAKVIDLISSQAHDVRYSMLCSSRNGDDVVRALGDHNINRTHIDYSKKIVWIIADESVTGSKGSVRERLKLAFNTPNVTYQHNIMVIRAVEESVSVATGNINVITRHKEVADVRTKLQALIDANTMFGDVRFLSSLPSVPKTAAILTGPGATKQKEQIYKTVSGAHIRHSHMYRLGEYQVAELDEAPTEPQLYLIGNKSTIKFNGGTMGVSRSTYTGYDFGGSNNGDLIHRWVNLKLTQFGAAGQPDRRVTLYYLTAEQAEKVKNQPNWVPLELQIIRDIGATFEGMSLERNMVIEGNQVYDRDVQAALERGSVHYAEQLKAWNAARLAAASARVHLNDAAKELLCYHKSLVDKYWAEFIAASKMQNTTQDEFRAVFSQGEVRITFAEYVGHVSPFLNACTQRNTSYSSGWEKDVCRLWNDSPTKITASEFIAQRIKEITTP